MRAVRRLAEADHLRGGEVTQHRLELPAVGCGTVRRHRQGGCHLTEALDGGGLVGALLRLPALRVRERRCRPAGAARQCPDERDGDGPADESLGI